jgi:hypothetical protein
LQTHAQHGNLLLLFKEGKQVKNIKMTECVANWEKCRKTKAAVSIQTEEHKFPGTCDKKMEGTVLKFLETGTDQQLNP